MTGFFSIPAWDSLCLVTQGSVLDWDVVIAEQAWDG